MRSHAWDFKLGTIGLKSIACEPVSGIPEFQESAVAWKINPAARRWAVLVRLKDGTPLRVQVRHASRMLSGAG